MRNNGISSKKINTGKLSWLILCTVLIILNGIRYNKLHYDILKEKWNHETASVNINKGVIVVSYILLSTLIWLGLIIYVGSKDWLVA